MPKLEIEPYFKFSANQWDFFDILSTLHCFFFSLLSGSNIPLKGCMTIEDLDNEETTVIQPGTVDWIWM